MTADTAGGVGQEHEHRTHGEHGEHRHDPECGHERLPHGDHADFLHAGHRHAEHDGHWDEHGTPAGDETMDWASTEQAAAIADEERAETDSTRAGEQGASAEDLLA